MYIKKKTPSLLAKHSANLAGKRHEQEAGEPNGLNAISRNRCDMIWLTEYIEDGHIKVAQTWYCKQVLRLNYGIQILGDSAFAVHSLITTGN